MKHDTSLSNALNRVSASSCWFDCCCCCLEASVGTRHRRADTRAMSDKNDGEHERVSRHHDASASRRSRYYTSHEVAMHNQAHVRPPLPYHHRSFSSVADACVVVFVAVLLCCMCVLVSGLLGVDQPPRTGLVGAHHKRPRYEPRVPPSTPTHKLTYRLGRTFRAPDAAAGSARRRGHFTLV